MSPSAPRGPGPDDSASGGRTRHCSADDPQYEIRSDKTDHVAMHKGEALKKA
ncbi:hypothetical protein BSZ07_18340 [Streptomyces sp. M1013]|nr:hypothetical protein BSZ07_18340 [Streptomyces sp. M1013]